MGSRPGGEYPGGEYRSWLGVVLVGSCPGRELS